MVGLGAIISLRFWGKLVDRFGNRFIFTLAIIAMPLFTAPWIFVGENSSILVLALFFLWSIFHSGNGIAQTRYMLHAVSPKKQNQINIINVISAFAMGLAPLFGGLFLKLTAGVRFNLARLAFDNYDLLFVISSAAFIAPYLLRKSLRQKKDTPTMHVLAIVTRPMLSIFGPFLRPNSRRTRS
jgi:MFS family permease